MAMQKTSIEKLCILHSYLTENGASGMAQIITEIIRAESQTLKLGKFDIFSFTKKKDELRPTLTTVYHSEGFRIATDGIILVASRDEYDTDLEGKMLLKDGSFLENGLYPNWRSVVPLNPLKNGWKECEFDKQKFLDRLSAVRAEYKATHGKSKQWDDLWYTRIGGVPFRAEQAAKFLAAMEHFGETKVMVKDASKPAVIQNEKGIALLMPMYESDAMPISYEFTEI